MRLNTRVGKVAAVFCAIQFLVAIVTAVLVIQLDVLPMKYFIVLIAVLLFLFVIGFLLQYSKKLKIVGIVYTIIISILSIVGCYYISKTNKAITDISGPQSKTDQVNIYVLEDDPARNLTEAAEYAFGYLENFDRTNTDQTIEAVNNKLNKEINTVPYEDALEMADALYQSSIQAVILNEAFIDLIIEQEGYEDFLEKTKIIAPYTYTVQIEKSADPVEIPSQESFTVYLSGIDTTGKVSKTSRSDVNIIAVVNPETKQILLLSTPRDYFLPLSISKGVKDKLTHAGMYGVDVSIDTLEMLYEIDINYYFRMNFTGFQKIIDALGGIEVWSDYAFTPRHSTYNISKGMNNLTGEAALGFARERYSFATGDRQRGKNQMEVIKGVLKKASSPAILAGYGTILDSLKDTFDTDMSSEQISELIKMQIAKMPSWNVVSYSVNGSDSKSTTYSMPRLSTYVMVPNQDTVNKAKELIKQVKDGEILSN